MKWHRIVVQSVVNNVIKFKCGDIIYNNEYNHYGVILSQSITPRGGDIVEYIWNRKDTGNFFVPIVSPRYIKHVIHRKLPEDLKFLYDISDKLAHVRVDYVISGERWGTTIGYHKLLTQILDSDNLSMVIERCVDVNKGVFAGDKIFFNEFEYWFMRCWVKYDNVEIRFYRV